MPKHASPHATGSDQLAATPDPADALNDICLQSGSLFEKANQIFPGVRCELAADPAKWKSNAVQWQLALKLDGTAHDPQRGMHVDDDCLSALKNLVAWLEGERRTLTVRREP